MPTRIINDVKIRITDNELQAYLNLPRPANRGDYSVDVLTELLMKVGIKEGIDVVALRKMIDEEIYYEDTLVAQGIEPVQGTDGYFTFEFDDTKEKKPKILEDGSVDYWNVNVIEMVKDGDVIATYTHPVQGTNGKTITGKPLIVHRGKELPPLKGKGFYRSEDGLTYKATVTGKVEHFENRVVISNVYEVSGDADVGVGNIDFIGDVVVHGAVRNGVCITAGGTITIDGIVEAAQLSAKDDIIIRSGMLGGSRAKIETRGNVYAKFLEFSNVYAEGNIEAESFLNCEIFCAGQLILKGKKGCIIGGTVHAIEGIDAAVIGNAVGIPTIVKAGVNIEIMRQVSQLKDQIKEKEEILDKVEHEIAQSAKVVEKEKKAFEKEKPEENKKVELLREKIKESALLNSMRMEYNHMGNMLERGKNAGIRIQKDIYPGVVMMIGDNQKVVQSKESHVYFKEEFDRIESAVY